MILLPLLLLAPALRAELPLGTYPGCGTEDRPDLCPSELGTDWELISYVPENARDSVRPEELELGSGNHADEAWALSTGEWEVALAFLDSGILWNGDLASKGLLNTGELPPPLDASGTECPDYDCDGNGIVNVQDWAEDPRVDPAAGGDPSLLDPADLLLVSWGPDWDGVDNDGNGFVDDICGWDFFEDDNDPTADDSRFGDHGTGVAEAAAAEGENGGDIGICPNCAVLPLRLADAFVVDGDRVALAVAYAVDRGARVINLSVGATSHPEAVREAFDYAREHGVVVVAAAADENSYHQNVPALESGALVVHSIRADNADESGTPYSYMNFFNCNNYGPRLGLSAASHACATGATAYTTGAAGLVHSAGIEAGSPLAAEQVVALLAGAADDIWLSEDELEEAGTYPSSEGWDPFYGYGRLNVGRAVQRVFDGELPPVVSLDEPRWFAYVRADGGPVELRGRVEGASSWTLSYGTGWDPREWTVLAEGSGDVDGTLASLDPAELPAELLARVPAAEGAESVVERVERVHAPAVTLRLVAEGAGRAELRRTFFVQDEPDLLDGFPVELGSSGESSPVLADLDGDGVLEILLGDSGGRVHALRGDGSEFPGFPLSTGSLPDAEEHRGLPAYASGALELPGDGIVAPLAAGDLDGDGVLEVVAATVSGAIWAWSVDAEGVHLRTGFPYQAIGREPGERDGEHAWDRGFLAAPTLYDLDGDGALEILAASLDGRLYALDAEGQDWGPYPIEVCLPDDCGEVRGFRVVASPAVGDVDGDGRVEIALGNGATLDDGATVGALLYDARTAELEPGWPVYEDALVPEANLLPIIGEGHPASLALADVDGDGALELADPVVFGQTPVRAVDGSVAMDLPYLSVDFGTESDADEPALIQMSAEPAWGDLDGDGVPDLVMAGVGTNYLISLALTHAWDFQLLAGAWSGADGSFLPGWPRQLEDVQFLSAPAIADVSGDGRPEAIVGSGGYLLHAWDADGNEAEGWPKFTGQWLMASPAVGDVDGDGYLDAVIVGRLGTVFAWRTAGRADQDVQWASVFHDARNTGNYAEPLPVQAGPPEPGSGGCCGHKGDTGQALLLLPLGWLWRRRRLAGRGEER